MKFYVFEMATVSLPVKSGMVKQRTVTQSVLSPVLMCPHKHVINVSSAVIN